MQSKITPTSVEQQPFSPCHTHSHLIMHASISLPKSAFQESAHSQIFLKNGCFAFLHLYLLLRNGSLFTEHAMVILENSAMNRKWREPVSGLTSDWRNRCMEPYFFSTVLLNILLSNEYVMWDVIFTSLITSFERPYTCYLKQRYSGVTKI